MLRGEFFLLFEDAIALLLAAVGLELPWYFPSLDAICSAALAVSVLCRPEERFAVAAAFVFTLFIALVLLLLLLMVLVSFTMRPFSTLGIAVDDLL